MMKIASLSFLGLWCQHQSRYEQRLLRCLVLSYWLMLPGCTLLQTLKGGAPETTLPLPEVASITFEGNAEFSSRTLRQQMATQERPLLPPWKRGEPYNAPTLDEDLKRLQKYYFDRGFLQTVVRLAEVKRRTDDKAVEIRLRIEEGQPTMVTAVQLTGPIPPELPRLEVLRATLPLRPHERLTREAFERSQALLLQRLRDASYARADVLPSTEVDTAAHTAIVTFNLAPGERTRFGPIGIEGREKVSERAIRRQLTFAEGDWSQAAEITASADAIHNLGTFSTVTPRLRNPEAAEEPLEAAFLVRERRFKYIQVGIGLSSVERLRLQVEWVHRNLFGEAEQLRLRAKVSSIEQTFETRLHVPYFLAPRATFTQTLFINNAQELNTDPSGLSDALFTIKDAQPAFDLLSLGGETRVTRQWSRRLSTAFGLELSRNTFRNVNLAALTTAEAEAAQDNLLFVQFAEVQWNTRDNALNPTRGLLLRGNLSHANTSVLSDVSFAKLILSGQYYRPLWDAVILATRLELGAIQPYGSSDIVPFNVRFFAGGPGSVRGFTLNRLGPLDSSGEPLGGNSLLEGSAEVRFPIIGDFGGALFVDFGNVFRESWTYRLSDLRYAVGPGIRYNTPIGPIRLDLGLLVDRRPGESFGRVEFSIGQAF